MNDALRKRAGRSWSLAQNTQGNDGVQAPKTQSNDVRQMSQDVERKPVRQVSNTYPDYFIILD